LALLFSWAGFPTAAKSQTSQTNPQKKAQTNSVSGRVTIHGKAAAGIVVGIRTSNYWRAPGPALKATTDREGNYRITDIPPGNYQVSPLAPAYFFSDLFSARANGKALLLGAGEDVEGVDFSLLRGGVITGKVTDADGRPVIEEQLIIVAEDQPNNRGQQISLDLAFQTDDRGVYRIYGLPVGRYKISVGVTDEESHSNVRFRRVAYKRTFYPDASEAADAKVIEVTEGSEAKNIDITVGRNLPSFAVSGRVVDGETGQPVTGLRFGLKRIVDDREADIMGTNAASNSRGEFRMENVTPGKYAVFIYPQPGSEARAEAVPFEMVDQDVSGLLVKTLKGLTITGTVALDGRYDKSTLGKLAELLVRVYVRDETSYSSSWQASPISPDGSFRLGGLGPGRANFSLSAQDRSPAAGFAILRIERDGVVQPRGVEMKSGEQTTGVRILVVYGTGSIRGEVKLENGPLPPGGNIVVWTKRLDETESNARPQNLDTRGHFLIDGLPAGSYEVNVNANLPGRRSSVAAKQLIDVRDGTTTDVVLSVDLKPNPGQPPSP